MNIEIFLMIKGSAPGGLGEAATGGRRGARAWVCNLEI